MASPPEASSTIPTPSYQQAPSLPVMIINAVNGIDPEILPHMLSNIVVVGGTSLTTGLVDRLTTEIQSLAQGVSFPPRFSVLTNKSTVLILRETVQGQGDGTGIGCGEKILFMARRIHPGEPGYI
jgi:hypothetical protein